MEKNVGLAIHELRTKKGLAQHEFGQKIGVSDSAVSCWESGKRIPRKKEIEKICKTFGVDYNYLFGLSDCENSEIIQSTDSITIPVFDRKCSKNYKNYSDFITSQKPITKIVLPNKCFVKKNEGYFAIYSSKKDIKIEGINDNDLLIFRGIIDKQPKRTDIVCSLNNGKLILYKSNYFKGNILGILTNSVISQ